jgi:hypothetical protein
MRDGEFTAMRRERLVSFLLVDGWPVVHIHIEPAETGEAEGLLDETPDGRRFPH